MAADQEVAPLVPASCQPSAALSFSIQAMPWTPRRANRLPFSGSPPTFVLGLWGVGVQFRSRLYTAAAVPGVAVGPWAPLSATPPACPPPPRTEAPEAVQEWPSGLAGQGQGERPHQLVHPLLSRKLLQCSEHLLFGRRLVPQDVVHLQGSVL